MLVPDKSSTSFRSLSVFWVLSILLLGCCTNRRLDNHFKAAPSLTKTEPEQQLPEAEKNTTKESESKPDKTPAMTVRRLKLSHRRLSPCLKSLNAKVENAVCDRIKCIH